MYLYLLSTCLFFLSLSISLSYLYLFPSSISIYLYLSSLCLSPSFITLSDFHLFIHPYLSSLYLSLSILFVCFLFFITTKPHALHRSTFVIYPTPDIFDCQYVQWPMKVAANIPVPIYPTDRYIQPQTTAVIVAYTVWINTNLPARQHHTYHGRTIGFTYYA